MIYKDKNGELIQGSSPLELVEDLRNGSRFGSEETLEEYMKGFAERTCLYSDHTVRFDNVDNFVTDLEACGYWKRVE